MSELSEVLKPFLEPHLEVDKDVRDGLVKQLTATQPLAWDTFKRWADWNIANLVRASRYYFNGKTPWEDGQQAMNETGEHMTVGLYSFLVGALAKGFIAGHAKDEMPAKYNWENLFTVKGEPTWLANQQEMERAVASDEDSMYLIRDIVLRATSFFVTLGGFEKATGRATQNVWGVWNQILKTSAATLYVAGIQTGAKCKEIETIEKMEKEISGFQE